MNDKSLDIKGTLFFGWKTAWERVYLFVPVMLLYLGAPLAVPLLFRQVQDSFIQLLLQGIILALSVIMDLGLTRICLNVYDGEKTGLRSLFKPAHLFFSAFAASLLHAMIFAAGLLLLILPGLFWGIRFGFYQFHVVNEECGPVESLRRSWILTGGRFVPLLGFVLALMLVQLAGLLCLGVGLLIAIPVTRLAAVCLFRRMERDLMERERNLKRST